MGGMVNAIKAHIKEVLNGAGGGAAAVAMSGMSRAGPSQAPASVLRVVRSLLRISAVRIPRNVRVACGLNHRIVQVVMQGVVVEFRHTNFFFHFR